MTEKGRILILFCTIFHDIDFAQLFYVKFVINPKQARLFRIWYSWRGGGGKGDSALCNFPT